MSSARRWRHAIAPFSRHSVPETSPNTQDHPQKGWMLLLVLDSAQAATAINASAVTSVFNITTVLKIVTSLAAEEAAAAAAPA